MPDPIVHFVTAPNVALLIILILLAVFWTVCLIIACIQPAVARQVAADARLNP
jgi:hypothetical protein